MVREKGFVGFETPGKGAALWGGSVRLKRLMRPLGGSVRLKRPKRHKGRFRRGSRWSRDFVAWSRGLWPVLARRRFPG